VSQSRKILIANRGEIACRIARTCKNLGYTPIGIYSESDKNSRHRRYIHDAYALNSGIGYLDLDAIVEIAKKNDVYALHPGYGFLSENPSFPEACRAKGILFIGPSAHAMRSLGNKKNSREIAIKKNIPVPPGMSIKSDILSEEEKKYIDEVIRYPIIIKSSAGGGGRGIRLVEQKEELDFYVEAARREAKNLFALDEVYIEKYIQNPRHIEVQIFGDDYGNVVSFLDRDCSIQRERQKLIEEAPAPFLTETMREKIHECAKKLIKDEGYSGAATVEFLLSEHNEVFFIEVNTRLQVEHTVTEEIFGIDLVELQIKIAEGFNLNALQGIRYNGKHSIQLRICAESFESGSQELFEQKAFVPSSGRVENIVFPDITDQISTNTLRIEASYETGDTLNTEYDSLFAKIILTSENRQKAIAASITFLENLFIQGVVTNSFLLKDILRTSDFQEMKHSTTFFQRVLPSFQSLLLEKYRSIIAGFIVYIYECSRELSSSWKDLIQWELTRLQQDRRYSITTSEGENYRIFLHYESHKDAFATALYKHHGAEKECLLLEGEFKMLSNISITNQKYRLLQASFLKNSRELFAIHYFQKTIRYAFGQYSIDLQKSFSDNTSDSSREVSSFVKAPLPGKIVKVLKVEQERGKTHEPIFIIESMKMEHIIKLRSGCTIKKILHKAGEFVKKGDILAEIEESQ
jgi:acetyl/propionyl-CoA carboxylase alpha subunit